MRIIFWGTSNVALPVLEALHREHELISIVTAPDAKVGRKQIITPSAVALLADELQLPLLKPETVTKNPELLTQLQKLAADIFIVVSYGKILPSEVINLPPHKTLNIHFSRLPEYRGASPIQFALLHGNTATATTIFVLDEQLDHGPIVAQEATVIESDDNFLTLSQRMARQSAELLLNALPDYVSGRIKPREQEHDQATYTNIITKADGKVDWTKSATEIYNQFRAFYPWPGIWTTWQNKTLKILDCLPGPTADQSTAPGTVLSQGLIACADRTSLKINSLQLEGKNPVNIQPFLHGRSDFVGSQLK